MARVQNAHGGSDWTSETEQMAGSRREAHRRSGATGSEKKSGRFRIGTALKAQFIRSPEGAEPHNTLLRDTGTCRKT